MNKPAEYCGTCGIRFKDVGLKAEMWCRRCGGPAAGKQRPKRTIDWRKSLRSLTAAVAHLVSR